VDVTADQVLENLHSGELTIEVRAAAPPAPLQLHWLGKSNDRQPGNLLAPFFSSALGVAVERGVPLEMHFERIKHFNSSTIAAIVQLMHETRRRSVQLIIVYDAALKWQKLSFDGLQMLARTEAGGIEVRSI
jgi:hypothetical protein